MSRELAQGQNLARALNEEQPKYEQSNNQQTKSSLMMSSPTLRIQGSSSRTSRELQPESREHQLDDEQTQG